jgi:HisA/HisF family protein
MSPASKSHIPIIPVIDILNGVVVRGIAGHREQYQPLKSQLTNSTNPIVVAEALIHEFNPPALYVADLDGIMCQQRNHELYQQLTQLRVPIWLDTGIQSTLDVQALLDLPELHLILGTETILIPEEIVSIECTWPAEQLLLSLDFRDGQFQHPNEPNPHRWLENSSINRVIVLNVSSVGMSQGPNMLETCVQLQQAFPTIQLITGGGIRDEADLMLLQQKGIQGALVASALHDGRI